MAKKTDTPPATCRLTLTIAGDDYSLRPVRVEEDGGRAWRLHKIGTDARHDVAETAHGPTCTCGDQTWRHEGLDDVGCKHIRALRACGLIG